MLGVDPHCLLLPLLFRGAELLPTLEMVIEGFERAWGSSAGYLGS